VGQSAHGVQSVRPVERAAAAGVDRHAASRF